MRLLISGVSGLLGINLAMEYCQNHVVLGVVHRHPIQTNRFQVVQADLNQNGEIARLLDDFQPDWVINCAALANLESCEADPLLAQQINSEL
ncbi:MAG: sugar nucleotide-binding protein, partial [Anaerolineales bacterium]